MRWIEWFAAHRVPPTLTDYERLEFELVLSDTEGGLDSETFAHLRGEGQAMSADATVAYALDYLRDGAVSR